MRTRTRKPGPNRKCSRLPRVSGRFLIHAGLPKTGSTAIQKFLTVNRSRLMEQGVHYPPSIAGAYQHIAFVRLGQKGGPNIYPPRRRIPIPVTPLEARVWATALLAIDPKCKNVRRASLILTSAEQYSSLSNKGLGQVFRALRPYWREREVDGLLFLRHPADLFASLVLERLKSAASIRVLPRNILGGGQVFCEVFEKTFGHMPKLQDFSSSVAASSDVVDAFLPHVPELENLVGFERSGLANPSVSPEAGAVIASLAKVRGAARNMRQQRLKSQLTRTVMRLDGELRPEPSGIRLSNDALAYVHGSVQRSLEYFSGHGFNYRVKPRSQFDERWLEKLLGEEDEVERVRMVFDLNEEYFSLLRTASIRLLREEKL